MAGSFPPEVSGSARQLEPGNGSGQEMGLICFLLWGGNSTKSKETSDSRNLQALGLDR